MDWQAAIDRQGTALRRVVAVLVAMLGVGPDPAAAAELAVDRPSLSRIRHRALLSLVRPAEAAARRLVIALALAVPAARDRVGAGIVLARPDSVHRDPFHLVSAHLARRPGNPLPRPAARPPARPPWRGRDAFPASRRCAPVGRRAGGEGPPARSRPSSVMRTVSSSSSWRAATRPERAHARRTGHFSARTRSDGGVGA